MFRIASMTKPITAIGIMILQDEGKLSVEDPVEKHLPEFKGQMLDREARRRPRHPEEAAAADHDPRPADAHLRPAGRLSGRTFATSTSSGNYTLAEATLIQSQRPLDFEPGSKWAYCNAGIDTLGRIIEVTSGQSYRGFSRATASSSRWA